MTCHLIEALWPRALLPLSGPVERRCVLLKFNICTFSQARVVVMCRPYSARGLGAAYPSEFSPVPGGVQPPPVGALTARGDHVNGGPRGAPLMVSQLQREVSDGGSQTCAGLLHCFQQRTVHVWCPARVVHGSHHRWSHSTCTMLV
jgi:hypothetical protein